MRYSLANGVSGYKPKLHYSLYGGVESPAILHTPDLHEVVPPVAIPVATVGIVIALIVTHLPAILHNRPGNHTANPTIGKGAQGSSLVLSRKPSSKGVSATSLSKRLKPNGSTAASATQLSPSIAPPTSSDNNSTYTGQAAPINNLNTNPVAGFGSGPVSDTSVTPGGTTSGTTSVVPSSTSVGSATGTSIPSTSNTSTSLTKTSQPQLQTTTSVSSNSVSADAQATVPIINQTVNVDPSL